MPTKNKTMTDDMFSKRHGFRQTIEAEISIRNDAPFELRGVIIQLAYECGFSPKNLREVVCKILRKRQDPNNWSEYPDIDEEIHSLIDECQWYSVYDVIEGIYKSMTLQPYTFKVEEFKKEINNYFIENGIGWQLQNGIIEIRGPESFEKVIYFAQAILQETKKYTAGNELHEALTDLSRRPEPDITGAIQHAMASLECVAREASGDQKATLGDILKRFKNLLPPPLDELVKKAWGYASENARHIREGQIPQFEEAELIVGICAAVGTYLSRKTKG